MAIEIFFAAVSAICSSTQVMMMQEERLRRFRIPEQRSLGRRDLPDDYVSELQNLNDEARKAGESAYKSPDWNATNNPELRLIAKKVPENILEAMKNNVQRCWDRLHHFISNNQYTPQERNIAHMLARKCVCDELVELQNYLGELPEDLQGYWNACGCPNPLPAAAT